MAGVIPYHFDVAGFAAGSGPYATVPARSAGVVIIPCWALTLLTLLPPLRWLRRRRQAGRRSDANLCRVCGDHLRATPDRCPECGAIPAPGRAGQPDSRPRPAPVSLHAVPC